MSSFSREASGQLSPVSWSGFCRAASSDDLATVPADCRRAAEMRAAGVAFHAIAKPFGGRRPHGREGCAVVPRRAVMAFGAANATQTLAEVGRNASASSGREGGSGSAARVGGDTDAAGAAASAAAGSSPRRRPLSCRSSRRGPRSCRPAPSPPGPRDRRRRPGPWACASLAPSAPWRRRRLRAPRYLRQYHRRIGVDPGSAGFTAAGRVSLPAVTVAGSS